MGWFNRHADKVGFVGSAVAAPCCLGTPPLIAFLAAIGAGFLVNDLVLLPLLMASLGLSLWGLWTSRQRHRRRLPFALGLAAMPTFIVAGIWVSAWLTYGGLAALFFATTLNMVFLRRQRQAFLRP